VEAPLCQLLPLFTRERAAGRAFALCVLLETAGSTYSKAGAMLLLAQPGEYAGLLSGGCVEADLAMRARQVIENGRPAVVSYDMRGPDDLLWGLGSGCEGAMQVLMFRCGPDNGWQPLEAMQRALAAHQALCVGIDVESGAVHTALAPRAEPGYFADPAGRRVFALPLELPPRVLILGAGPDCEPVVEFATRLGWKLTVYDHRAAYAEAARFPQVERIVSAPAAALAGELALAEFDAAVVMSHHLRSDLDYLRALAHSTVPFIGLLGPAPRRDRLHAELGGDSALLAGRLHAPVGLDIGGRSSAAIALAIVAELQAWFNGAPGRSFSRP
jgi:xanthine/CO dehydrogenase XdhC/CoxF family maturation factor